MQSEVFDLKCSMFDMLEVGVAFNLAYCLCMVASLPVRCMVIAIVALEVGVVQRCSLVSTVFAVGQRMGHCYGFGVY